MLTGKTAIITGCLKGIGRSTLDVFAKNGASVFACAQYQTEEFEDYCTRLNQESEGEIIPTYFDLSRDEEIKEAAMFIRKQKRPADILVNIAGYTKDARFQMVSMEDMQKTFKINFFSQIAFTQYIVKMMIRNKKGGAIINTSSISGIDGSIGQLSYSASKAALIAATKVMAEELGEHLIRVNAIAPGFIDTDMYNDVPKEILDRKIAKTKLKHMGRPEDVAETILYLASDASRHITGQIIRIDGGKGI